MTDSKRPVMVPDNRTWVQCPSCFKVYLVPRGRAHNTLCACTMSPRLDLSANLVDALNSDLPKPTVCQLMPGDPLRITGYNAPEDHAIAQEFLKKHAQADELIADPDTGMVISAVYHEPVRQHYEQSRAKALQLLAAMAAPVGDDDD